MFDGLVAFSRGLADRVGQRVRNAPISADEKYRLQHYTVFVLIGVPILLIYGLHNFIRSEYLLCSLISASGIGLSIGWYLLGKLKCGILVYRVNAFLFALLLLYMLKIGGQAGSKALWMFTFPLIAFFMLGKNEGLAWVGAIFALAVGLLWMLFGLFSVYEYPEQFKIRFVTSFSVVAAIAYWFEYLRHQYRSGMERERQALQEEQALLRQQVEEREKTEKENALLIQQLQQALSKVKLLSGFLPICASCKKIRDDKGYWNQVEFYIKEHSEAEFSHGICPECAKKLYPEYFDDK